MSSLRNLPRLERTSFNHSKNCQQCLTGKGFSFPFSGDPNNTAVVREGRSLTCKAASSSAQVLSQVGSLPSQPRGRPEDACRGVSSRSVAAPRTQGARSGSSSPKVQRPFWPLNPHFPAHFLRQRQHVCCTSRSQNPAAQLGQIRGSRAPPRPRAPQARRAARARTAPRPLVTAENPSVSKFPRSTASLEIKPPSPQLQSTRAHPTSPKWTQNSKWSVGAHRRSRNTVFHGFNPATLSPRDTRMGGAGAETMRFPGI